MLRATSKLSGLYNNESGMIRAKYIGHAEEEGISNTHIRGGGRPKSDDIRINFSEAINPIRITQR